MGYAQLRLLEAKYQEIDYSKTHSQAHNAIVTANCCDLSHVLQPQPQPWVPGLRILSNNLNLDLSPAVVDTVKAYPIYVGILSNLIISYQEEKPNSRHGQTGYIRGL